MKCWDVGENLVQFEHSEEGLLWHLHVADFLHALLASFLLLEQFSLTADVAAITFCSYVLAHLFHRFASYDFGSDGRCNGPAISFAL